MPDELEADFALVRKLKHLSTRFQKGWRKLHPLSDEQKEKLQKGLEKEWPEQRSERKLGQGKAARQTAREKAEQAEQERKKQQSKNQGHSH